jgi:hypothetical protein
VRGRSAVAGANSASDAWPIPRLVIDQRVSPPAQDAAVVADRLGRDCPMRVQAGKADLSPMRNNFVDYALPMTANDSLDAVPVILRQLRSCFITAVR